jgi:hypothetical protein
MHTIPADHLVTVLAAHKLRRYTQGRTCQLCVVTAAPLLQVDCHHGSRHTTAAKRAQALKDGNWPPHITPLRRGHISSLYARTRLHHGLKEVRRTWGAGLRALLAEPKHALNGGQP